MSSTIFELQAALASGATTSLTLTQQALDRAEDPAGQGKTVFTRIYHDQALAAARASDALRQAGLSRSPLEGLPISVKDLFDVAGEPTLAGSTVLRDAAPARRHAVVVQRLLNAGAVVTAKTNMVEFAFSGVGLNPHYGTPASPWDRETGRIPGGSSSGAGVAVADGLSVASIGSDTGGSVRIPAAFCGVAGFKPTARRVPTQGALPLSTSLDSLGGLAPSVACCAVIDAVLSDSLDRDRFNNAGEAGPEDASFGILAPLAANRLNLAVPANGVLDGADDTVRATFDRALQCLREAGAAVSTLAIPEFDRLADLNARGGVTGAEAWAWHQSLVTTREAEYDPRVASRILRCRTLTAADYIELIAARQAWIAAVERRLRGYDALLMPTVPIVAPAIQPLLDSDEAYFAANRLILRNPTYINFLDGCALSIPCHSRGQAPVGLMIAGPAMSDRHILNVGSAIEQALNAVRHA
ncbi:MAG TPA: amidase [Castellaniella sp.]|jgi:aspartyl-tRNA(Asn)/glutamyl-tRNA(Gln) amidotransferase subunit A|nr:amidase [Castellaniella sp.]